VSTVTEATSKITQPGGYYDDMKAKARADLIKQLEAAYWAYLELLLVC
jgi:hypothetical protein